MNEQVESMSTERIPHNTKYDKHKHNYPTVNPHIMRELENQLYTSVGSHQITKMISNRLWILSHELGTVHALQIQSHYFIVPKHFIDEVLPFGKETLCNLAQSPKSYNGIRIERDIVLNHYHIKCDDLDDYAIVYIPDVPSVTSIVQFMIDKPVKEPCKGFIVHKCDEDGNVLNNTNSVDTVFKHDGKLSYTLGDKVITISNQYKYQCDNYPGLCGAPMVLNDFGGRSIILGIHCAGYQSSGISFGLPIFKNRVLHLIDDLKENIKMPQAQLYFDPPGRKILPLTFNSDLHQKSPIHTISGQAIVYGTCNDINYGIPKKSRVMRFNDKITTPVKTFYGVDDIWQPPIFRPKLHKGVWVDSVKTSIEQGVKPASKISVNLLLLASQDYYNQVTSLIPHDYIKQVIHPIPDDININGSDGVAYFNRIPLNTSMGYPFFGSKRKFAKEVDIINHKYEFDPIVMDHFRELDNSYRKGYCRGVPIFGSFKDEVVKKSKLGRTRIFNTLPLYFNLVVRKYLMGFVRMMQTHNLHTECAVGVSAMSQDWDKIAKYITQYSDMVCDGDFASFDAIHCAMLILYIGMIILKICKLSGNYSKEDLQAVECIFVEISNAHIIYGQELIIFFGRMPSGWPLTTIMNCIANSLYHRIAFFKITGASRSLARQIIYENKFIFRLYVMLISYGDDVLWSAKEGSKFTFLQVQQYFKSIGIKYTDATKTPGADGRRHFSKVTFLKRNFLFNKDVNRYLGPLDKKTLCKMLIYINKSRVISQGEQLQQMIVSNNLEAAAHGREFHKRNYSMLKRYIHDQGIKSLFLENNKLLNYDQVIAQYYTEE